MTVDPKTLRLVVAFVGLVVLAVVLGSIALLGLGKPIDAALVGLAGVGLGYLGGVLTPAGHSEQPVSVTTPPGQPLPVDPVDAAPPSDPSPALEAERPVRTVRSRRSQS